MNLYINTCVLPRSRLETAKMYRERFGPGIGFDLLPMFDIPEWEDNLRENIAVFAEGPLTFHEPVWGVEHSAPKGSPAWEEGMYHLRLTQKYARFLQPTFMVVHLNNCPVPPERRDFMLKTALENVEELRSMFRETRILIENTGTLASGNVLLDQEEFTYLCRSRELDVLIDVGHANANGWDIPRLLDDLKSRIRGLHLNNNDGVHDLHYRLWEGTLDFDQTLSKILSTVPDATRIIEYTNPAYHGQLLCEDIDRFLHFPGISLSSAPETEARRFSPFQTINSIFTNMANAVCLTDRQGLLLFNNPAAENLLGISSDHRKKEKIWEVIPFVENNDDLIQLFIEAIQTRNTTRQSVVNYENNEGKRFQFWVSMTYTEDNNGMFIIIIDDLTQLEKVSSAFTRYTSPQIADFVLNTPEEEQQVSQSRNVSILMSDLRGFTAISSVLSPERLVSMINHYFGVMVDIINRWQGTVIEFLGDGIFVVFGAPKDDPLHAEHAVSCAIEMQNAMAAVNEWNSANGYPILEMGIGINSGDTVVGNIGSDTKMKYGCVGKHVNLAGRVEALTVGGQVMISSLTRDQITQPLKIRGNHQIMPKGASEPLEVFDISGIGDDGNLEIKVRPVHWRKVLSHAELTFRMLNEHKSVSGEKHSGTLLALSADDRFAVLRTDFPLPLEANLLLEIGGDLYAKIVDSYGEDPVLCFTSRPASYDEWKRSLGLRES